MLSSTDNNFMICLFDFERFSIEPRFFFIFYSHCIEFSYVLLPFPLSNVPGIALIYEINKEFNFYLETSITVDDESDKIIKIVKTIFWECNNSSPPPP